MDLQFDASFAEYPGGNTTSAAAPVIQSPPDTASLQEVNVQNRVEPDASMPITAEVGNDTCVRANIAHPDYCTEILSSGWNMTVSAVLENSQDATGKCHGCGSRQAYDLTVTAPSTPGEYTLLVQLFGTNTGDMIATEEIPITVETDAPENPYTPPENGDEEGGGGDQTPLENLIDSLTLGTDSAAVPLVILVVILVALLYLTAI